MSRLNTIIFLITLSVLATTHYLSLEFYLYWRYLWLDMPMHFLGGTMVALGLFSAREFFPRLPVTVLTFFATVCFVLLVAVGWEVFEFVFGISSIEANLFRDTVTDLAMGLLGGVVGWFVGSRIRKSA